MTNNAIAEPGTAKTLQAPVHTSTLPLKKPGKASGKKRFLVLAIGVIVLGTAWTGVQWWREGRFLQETDDAYIGANITVISARVPGYIAQMLVSDNQAVHAGEVLVRLDDRDYRAALQKAEGAIAGQQALLANLDATRHLQQAVIAQAQAGVAASGIETGRARDDQVRYQSLSSRAAVSVQSAQKADAMYQQAQAGDQKSRAALSASQRELDVIATRRQQVQASLTQVTAERDMARLNLEYTQLRAPFDGTIGNRRARSGAYAGTGSNMLSVVPAQGMWVDANFKEGQVTQFRPGMRASVTADVLPGHVFHGTVASLAPATGAQFSVLPTENATGNFTKIVQRVPVRIVLDGVDGALGILRPGLSVTAVVDLRGSGKAAQ